MGARLRLGEGTDPATHQRTGEPVLLDADDLTTHGVIVGMTGSGKTGLGVVVLEEALHAGVPTLVLDPKGDLANLLLQFEGPTAEDLAPWVPAGTDAAAAASGWAAGRAAWGVDDAFVRTLVSGHVATVLTPGSTSGVPLDLFGSLQPPGSTDLEVRADAADAVVGGLLGLVGIDADPLSSREHILLTNLVQRAWADGTPLDLAGLVVAAQDPPLRKLGVLELDTFFPKADRAALARKLNGLLASPAFAAWSVGVPLDIPALLWAPDGRPRCSVVALAHLDDAERQTVVARVLGALVAWMRTQQGSPSLRVLVYLDETSGFVPPSAVPPAKRPILTLLKQARAFGVGVVLATQNPVDLDYKALSNAGTWLIGRLTTERDKARLLEGMTSASGAVDIASVDRTISGLATREFVLQRAGSTPRTIASRWAVSYLAGPLRREQISRLPGMAAAMAAVPPARSAQTAGATAPADGEVAVAPDVAEGIPVRFLHPSAPWGPQVRAVASSRRFRAAVAARVALRYDDARAGLDHQEEYEAVYPLVAERLDPTRSVVVDYDDRDLLPDGPPDARFLPPAADVGSRRFWTAAEASVRDHLVRTRSTAVLRNRALRLFSRPGEDEAAFRARCQAAADAGQDAAAAVLRKRYGARIDRAELAAARAEDRAEDQVEAGRAARSDEVLGGLGSLAGALLGGRRSARGLAGAARSVARGRNRSSRASGKVEAAANRVAEARAALADLEAELAEDLLLLDQEWDAKARDVEAVEVGLERADVQVVQLALVWVGF